MQCLQQENGNLHDHLCKQHSHYFLVFKYLLGEPSTACWWLLCLAPEPPASETLSFHMERAISCWHCWSWPCLYLGAVKCPPQWDSCWPRKSSWSPGVSTTAPTQGLALLQEEIAQLWNVLGSAFHCHSLAACSQCSCFPKWAAVLPVRVRFLIQSWKCGQSCLLLQFCIKNYGLWLCSGISGYEHKTCSLIRGLSSCC